MLKSTPTVEGNSARIERRLNDLGLQLLSGGTCLG
jgi:hypothetical protein